MKVKPKPIVVVSRRLPNAVESRLQQDYAARLRDDDAPLSSPQLLARCAGADALLCTLGDRIDAGFIAALPPSVRLIATVSAGFDHIDVAAAARGITVTNTPGVLTQATAELAMLLILGAARRANEGDRLIRENGWQGWAPTHLLGTQISGRRLGIVGPGRIGQALAKIARGFDMDVFGWGRGDGRTTRGSIPLIADEADFLSRCDVLSLHVPLLPATAKWLNRRRIDQMPDGAIVVNTARGEIVDDDALIDALHSGRIRAAGLDVYSGEPSIDPRYRALPNTLLLPHLGSATVQTRNAMGFCALDNLNAFFAGRQPPHWLSG